MNTTNLSGDRLSVEEYLAGEKASTQKREFVAGSVYPFPDPSERHNLIASNTTISLGLQLRGTQGRVFGSDTKIRIETASEVRFYYPDCMFVRNLNSDGQPFQDQPEVVVEVISSMTRRTDEVEKMDIYRSLDSLDVYILIEQSQPKATVHRRVGNVYGYESYVGLQAVIPLPKLKLSLPLAEIYESVVLA